MATPSSVFDPNVFDPGVFDTGVFDTGIRRRFTQPVPDSIRRCYTCTWVGRIDLTNAIYDRDGNPDFDHCPADGSLLRPRHRAEAGLGPAHGGGDVPETPSGLFDPDVFDPDVFHA